MTNNRPKISFITTARNDDYGGNLINRINAFLKSLSYLTDKHQLDSELIFVEYNPPREKKYLYEVLTVPDRHYLDIRFVVVPENFHQKFSTATKIPVLEYIAKNIGARHARGNYIACLNPDIVLSDGMIGYIKKEDLDSNCFYRADRYDVYLTHIDENKDYDAVIKDLRACTTQIWSNVGIMFTSYKPWLSRFIRKPSLRNLILFPLFNAIRANSEKIHEAAAGDFLLVHRDKWNEVGGYDQQPLSSFLDGYILYLFHCIGMRQSILPYPIYHISHKIGKAGRPEVDLNKYQIDKEQMLKTMVPYKAIDTNWGYPNDNFNEIVFNRSQ